MSNQPLILHVLFVRELKRPCAKPKVQAEPRVPAACPWDTAQPMQGPGQEGQRCPQPWAQLARGTVPMQSHSGLPCCPAAGPVRTSPALIELQG